MWTTGTTSAGPTALPAEFTRRQHSYAQAAGEHTVYTPQMVVGGIDHIVGTRPMALMDLIRAHADIAGDVTLEVSRDGDVLQVRAVARQGLAQGMVVQMVRYTPEATVDIPRGENAGRTMVYANIVTSWENLGDWPGDAPLALDVPVTGADPAVIVIQRPGPGLILAAAVVR